VELERAMLDRNLRNRYSRQTMFPGIGEEGQEKLVKSRAVVIGCGALGSHIAAFLVRAGLGEVTVIDRDFIEEHNLQRQVLFDEEDIKDRLPKAVAAERRLKKVNSNVKVRGIVADTNATNIEKFCREADVILDGLDNAETRYLINDVSLKLGIPWVYGGAIAANGMTMTIVPGETPCFRCISPPELTLDAAETCETAGVVGTAPAVVAAIQATEAMKLLVDRASINRELLLIDVWRNVFERLNVSRKADCPACQGRYEFLDKPLGEKVTSLCGQSRAVQVLDPAVPAADLDRLAEKLKGAVKDLDRRPWFLGFTAGEQEVLVFPDGRAIVQNTVDTAQARALYDRFVRRMG
jgi:molybdopterin/thiamine biosynthesis adenylyltransferase